MKNVSRSTSFLLVLVAYILCFIAGYFTLFLLEEKSMFGIKVLGE